MNERRKQTTTTTTDKMNAKNHNNNNSNNNYNNAPPKKRVKNKTNSSDNNYHDNINDIIDDDDDIKICSCLNISTLFASSCNQNNNNSTSNTSTFPQSQHYLKQFQVDNQIPYPHNVLEEFCDPQFLKNVLEEIKLNTKVNFKESDLFKFYQSIDLANLKDDVVDYDDDGDNQGDTVQIQMPSLIALKRALYSKKFRRFMEDISGLPPHTLIEKVDCAANCHTNGCHLLCHDDVIGTRKLSYIIYLTDPDDNWSDTQGGRLELYDHYVETVTNTDGFCGEGKSETLATRKAPKPYPCKTILPKFNSLAYFAVLPGESFHSVQEVFGDDSVRLSIQGWYHAKDVPEHMENATLQRLKSVGRGEDTESPFQLYSHLNGGQGDKVNEEELSQADTQFLGKYINETYLKSNSMADIRARFEEESSVQLRHFLNDEWGAKLQTLAIKKDSKDGVGKGTSSLDYSVGETKHWKPVGPAHKQRFLEFSKTNETNELYKEDPGILFQRLKFELFESPIFAKFLGTLTSLGVATGHRGRVRRFRPGLDYSVAHYGILTTSHVLDATLCFVAGNGNQCVYDEQFGDLVGNDDDAIWESGDVGGFECYIAADDDDEETEPQDEYVADDDTELLSVSASNNTFSLVYRDPGTMRFVKYVSSSAPSSRWDVSFEYDIPNDDIEENNDEDYGTTSET